MYATVLAGVAPPSIPTRLEDGPQRRNVSFPQRDDPLRRREILEAMLTNVSQVDPVRERRRRLRDQHLHAVSRRRDPRRPVYIELDVSWRGSGRNSPP